MKKQKDWRKEADRLFSLLVRQENADEEGMVTCCTCGKAMHWRKIHCGHFMSRRHQATRFEKENTAPQCSGCNTFGQGKQYEFGMYLDKKYGKGTAQEMCELSKTELHRKQSDFKELCEQLLEELTDNQYLTR